MMEVPLTIQRYCIKYPVYINKWSEGVVNHYILFS